jgi:hypothetical protein
VDDISCLIFDTLNNKKSLGSPVASMWSLSDKYAHIPFLRFKFKNIEFDDIIYKKVEGIITSFNGKIKWTMVANQEKTLNYFILPEFFKNYVFTIGLSKDKALKVFDEDTYKKLIDVSIADIPDLAKHIENNMF